MKTGEAGRGTPKVVCIDDKEEMVDLLTFILKTNGFEGLGAESGLEGLALIASAKPDLVLLDIMMPDMNGWEVYKRMKADEYMRTIPVIVVSALAQPIDILLAMKIAEVDDYITKPFSPDDLVSSIHKVLAGSSRASSL